MRILIACCLALCLVACSSKSSPPAAASTTQMIGPEGGTLTGDGLTLTIPKNALATTQAITVTRTDTTPAAPWRALSAVYKLEPEGLSLGRPAVVTIHATSTGAHPGVFWSTRAGHGFERRASASVDGGYAAWNTHFSEVFVGDAPSTGPTAGVFSSVGASFAAKDAAEVADLDGDGNADLVFATADGNIAAARGMGDGTFATPATLFAYGATLAAPTKVVVADVDGDGKADVMFSGPGGPGLALADGTGHFGAVQTVSTSGGLLAAAYGSLDRDSVAAVGLVAGGTLQVFSGFPLTMSAPVPLGFPATDLFVGNTSGATPSPLFVVAGQGSFLSADSWGVPSSVRAIVDGTPGLASSGGALDVSVATSSGVQLYSAATGTPGANTSLATSPLSLSTTDLDLDGDTDYVVAVSTGAQVVDQAGHALDTLVGTDLSRILTGDLNGDGFPDLVGLSSTGQVTSSLTKLAVPAAGGDGGTDAGADGGAGPVITSIPAAAIVGELIFIKGQNLRHTRQVTFMGSLSRATIDTSPQDNPDLDHQCLVAVPLDAIDGPISVKTDEGMATSATSIRIGSAAYPSITSMTPAGGDVGTEVTLLGTSLVTAQKITYEPAAPGMSLVDAPLTVVDDGTLKTSLPVPYSGTFIVQLDPTVFAPARSKTFYALPTIKSATLGFSPCTQCVIDLVGTNFGGAAVAHVNGFAIVIPPQSSCTTGTDVCVQGETEIKGAFTFPSEQAGITAATVTTPGGVGSLTP